MDAAQRALVSSPPLPLPLLSELGKGSLRDFIRRNDSDAINEFTRLWEKLVSTAKSPQVTDKHMTTAANALCVFLNAGVSSGTLALKALILSQETWFEAFQCVHKAFDEGKTKPAFQILETLCSLIQQVADPTDLLTRSTLPLLRTLLLASPRSDLKKACLILSCFVRKTAIIELLQSLTDQTLEENAQRWNQCLSSHNLSNNHISSLGHGSISSFLFALIFAMVDLDTRTSALKLCSILCSQSSDKVASSHFQALTERGIALFLERNHTALGYFAENVLPVILGDKTKLLAFVKPYTSSCRQVESRMAVFLAALKVGRSKNILFESEMLELLSTALPLGEHLREGCHSYSSFQFLMTASSSELRILGYGLLTISPAANAIVPCGVLNMISSCMKYLHDDADAHERGEILSITRKLLRRIQTSFAAFLKSSSDKDTNEANSAVLANYQSFSRSMYGFLKFDLSPQSSYQRRILSLQTLRYFFNHTIEPEIFEVDVMLVKLLASLVLDPFEDVRVTSTVLLKTLSARAPKTVAMIINNDFTDSVKSLALHTVRGDHADGMGRLWALYDTLPEQPDSLLEARNRGSRASHLAQLALLIRKALSQGKGLGSDSTLPVHGSLLAISYRIQDMKSERDGNSDFDHAEILKICITIWDTVRPILCVDSPETAYEAEHDDSKEGPKDLLAYSWRALRDSSLVTQALLFVASPDSPLFSDIGDVCIDQLISLRHRGAFSTVAQTFAQCCERVRTSRDAGIRSLIEKWYMTALGQIYEQANRLTRRSAGLPAMLLALLSPSDPVNFSSAVSQLISIARAPTQDKLPAEGTQENLPQVHALNCLKEITTNSRFSTSVPLRLNSILELAATSLSSQIWAIRNCGLMLLRACINRLDSTTNEDSFSPSSQRPDNSLRATPRRIALRLLSEVDVEVEEINDSKKRATEYIFAALDLLGHATIIEHQDEAINYSVIHQLHHSSWAVRDHAALLLSRRLFGARPSILIKKLISESHTAMSQNQAHGILLCCRYILNASKRILDEAELGEVLTSLAIFVDSLKLVPRRSAYVEAAWLDVLNDSAALMLENQWSFKDFYKLEAKGSAFSAEYSGSLHNPYLLQRLLLFKIYISVFVTDSGSTSSQHSALIDKLSSNPDSLSYALDNLADKHLLSHQSSLLLFLARLTQQLFDKAEVSLDVVVLAITCLLKSLDQMSSRPHEELLSILSMIDLTILNTREGMNAAIRLEAYLLISSAYNTASEKRCSKRLSRWIEIVQLASMDPLDFPTRWSAAKAVSTYFRLRGQAVYSRQDHRRPISLKMIMYDLLNDDDEDVRQEAVQAVSWALSQENQTLHNLGVCPVAARELLLRSIIQEHDKTSELAESAALRIMRSGQNVDETSSAKDFMHIFAIPVAFKLRSVWLSRNDLFAEERQNLYIDDIQEVKRWTVVLEQCNDMLTYEKCEIMGVWALEGLVSVLSALQDDQTIPSAAEHVGFGEERSRVLEISPTRPGWGHPFGPTYDQEMLVVLIQVISIAGVLLRSKRSHIVRRQIQERLQQIQQICQGRQANDVFVTTLQQALADK